MDQNYFNQMQLPRRVKLRPNKTLFLVGLYLVMALIPIFLSYKFFKEYKFNINIKENGVKTTGRIDDIHRVRKGKGWANMVRYTYTDGKHYYSTQNFENYGNHSVGQLVTVYYLSDNSKISRAEFTLGESSNIKNRAFMMILGLMFPIFFVSSAFTYIYVLPRNILKIGTMTKGTIMSFFRGRSQGADVKYVVSGVEKTRRIVFTLRAEKEGDIIQVVYDPGKPDKVVMYPNSFFEVLDV